MAESWIVYRSDYVELHNMQRNDTEAGTRYTALDGASIKVHVGAETIESELERGQMVYVAGGMVHIPTEKAERKVRTSGQMG